MENVNGLKRNWCMERVYVKTCKGIHGNKLLTYYTECLKIALLAWQIFYENLLVNKINETSLIYQAS